VFGVATDDTGHFALLDGKADVVQRFEQRASCEGQTSMSWLIKLAA